MAKICFPCALSVFWVRSSYFVISLSPSLSLSQQPSPPSSAVGAGRRFIAAAARLAPPRHRLIPHEASLYGAVSSAPLTWEATYF